MRQNKEAIVNIYELKEDWDGFKLLSFEEENEKWLDFVCACRKGENINSDYDIIIGNAAGDEDIGLVGGRESFGRYHFSRKFHL